ncbi:shikimate dehydrogenase family protein [Parapedobacter sp.]
MRNYSAAERPTMYFIGVTTAKSSIMKVFPKWAEFLQLKEVEIKGIDFNVHDDPGNYREAVDFIKHDPNSLGALVTTHKMDLLKSCRDQFDTLDEYATLMHEVSSISKHGNKLVGHAKDPITSGLSLEAFLPADHWERTGAEALILGAGGSGIALSWHLARKEAGRHRPSRLIVTNRSEGRINEMKAIHKKMGMDIPVTYHVTGADPAANDEILGALKPGSLVVNATGLGKDGPGSPLTDRASFPQQGLVWDFNYRGDLVFLGQARRQRAERGLQIEDGWIYFLHGWTRVIAEVFHIDIPTSGPVFDQLSRIASTTR